MGDKGDFAIDYYHGPVLTICQSLIPLLVVLVSSNELLPKLTALPIYGAHDDAAKEPYNSSDTQSHAGSFRILAVATLSAGAVLAVYSVPATSALGVSSAIFTATGLVLFGKATKNIEDDDTNDTHDYMPANGAPSGSGPSNGTPKGQQLATLRDVAATMAIVCGLASILVEPSANNTISWQPVYRHYNRDWRTVHDFRILRRTLFMVPTNVLFNVLMCTIVSCPSRRLSCHLNVHLVSLFTTIT
jgi:hypothetical protein